MYTLDCQMTEISRKLNVIILDFLFCCVLIQSCMQSLKTEGFNISSFTSTAQFSPGITIECSHFCGEYIFCWAIPMEAKYVSPLADFCFSNRAIKLESFNEVLLVLSPLLKQTHETIVQASREMPLRTRHLHYYSTKS